MLSSLSGLVNNLSEGLHNYKCTNCKSCLDYIPTKYNQLVFKCVECSSLTQSLVVKSHKKHLLKI